ncbi:hypothetical protein L208DRAFT_1429912, partial [Tricholoma matsutake]
LLASISFICAEPTSFKLFHRLYQPTEEQTSFSERGLLLLSEDNVLSFQPSPSYVRDLNAFAQALRTASDSIDLALYQVALEREGDVKQWDISSVKVCHLYQVTSEFIYLHTLGPHSDKPYAIDYFVSPIPHEGACPKSTSKKNSPAHRSPFHAFAKNNRLNTTVVLQSTRYPPLPELSAPPPLSSEGDQIVSIPEKTFLQKYWIYIVVALFALS